MPPIPPTITIPSCGPVQACSKIGCFLLLRKKVGFTYHQLTLGTANAESYVLCAVERQNQTLLVLSAYLPCNGTAEAVPSFNLLASILEKLQREYPQVPLFVCGDFNAHLGIELLTIPAMHGLIGPNLRHTETKENGEMLAGITSVHRLGTATSLFSSSTLVTRTHGSTQSQLDHILIHENLVQHVINIYGEWQPFSDYKLIVMDMSPPCKG